MSNCINKYQKITIYNSIPKLKVGLTIDKAGDVNGDGYSDIILGTGRSGGAYIVLGSPNFKDIELSKKNTTNVISISNISDLAGERIVVGWAGDVNKDGYDDILLAARTSKYSIGYVIFGAKNLTNIDLKGGVIKNGFAFRAKSNGYGVSLSVSGVGDINKDGYDDVAIGVPGKPGICYLVYGSSASALLNLDSLNSNKGFSIKGGLYNDGVGKIISSAGDVNKDGFDDFLIGAPLIGTTYVILGSNKLKDTNLNEFNSTMGFIIKGRVNNEWSGASLSSAGDVNKDGYGDIIVGAPGAGNKYSGAAYVLYGSNKTHNILLNSLKYSEGYKISGSINYEGLGNSVSWLGDINRDGYDDIIIGPLQGGSSYIIYGKRNSQSISTINFNYTQGDVIKNIENMGGLPLSLRGAGDINNDGFADFIIGSPGGGMNYSGLSHVFLSNDCEYTVSSSTGGNELMSTSVFKDTSTGWSAVHSSSALGYSSSTGHRYVSDAEETYGSLELSIIGTIICTINFMI